MIVDMRLRPPLKSWTSKQQYRNDKSEQRYQPTQMGYPRPPSAQAHSFDLLLKEMNEAGIQCGVIMGRQSVEPNGSIPNDEIFECVAQYPDKFVGWAGLDLGRGADWWLQEIRRCAALKGCKGISIEPTQSLDASITKADDRRLYPIYEECLRLDLPVSIGLSAFYQAQQPYMRYEDGSPVQVFRVARDFPRLQVVCSHGGWPFVHDMIGVAFDCPNVWISPDMYMVPLMPFAHEYVTAANTFFPDRTLFGTAYPSRPLRETVVSYREWNWKPGVLEKVLYKNARRLMKMD